jgi:hypothetical protein
VTLRDVRDRLYNGSHVQFGRFLGGWGGEGVRMPRLAGVLVFDLPMRMGCHVSASSDSHHITLM